MYLIIVAWATTTGMTTRQKSIRLRKCILTPRLTSVGAHVCGARAHSRKHICNPQPNHRPVHKLFTHSISGKIFHRTLFTNSYFITRLPQPESSCGNRYKCANNVSRKSTKLSHTVRITLPCLPRICLSLSLYHSFSDTFWIFTFEYNSVSTHFKWRFSFTKRDVVTQNASKADDISIRMKMTCYIHMIKRAHKRQEVILKLKSKYDSQTTFTWIRK